MDLIIGLFVVVAIAAIIVWIADYASVPRGRIEEMKNRPPPHDRRVVRPRSPTGHILVRTAMTGKPRSK